ncbi:helix-turn-helix domain-containing protein [Amycolatopsis sp. NPDC021455]|uniref:helix-turn-helix domain-containing protein n=1 Tax=Amycolatopsis sp. NPDC021455 TaxID=3154901 RepID=UPI0034000860
MKKRFNDDEILAIARDRDENRLTDGQLANKYGCCKATIHKWVLPLSNYTPRKGRPFALSPTQVDEMAELYNSGYSIAQCARKFHVGNETARKRLVEHPDVTMRGFDGKPRRA